MCVKLAYLAFLAIFVVVLGTTTVTLVPVATSVVAGSMQHIIAQTQNNDRYTRIDEDETV